MAMHAHMSSSVKHAWAQAEQPRRALSTCRVVQLLARDTKSVLKQLKSVSAPPCMHVQGQKGSKADSFGAAVGVWRALTNKLFDLEANILVTASATEKQTTVRSAHPCKVWLHSHEAGSEHCGTNASTQTCFRSMQMSVMLYVLPVALPYVLLIVLPYVLLYRRWLRSCRRRWPRGRWRRGCCARRKRRWVVIPGRILFNSV